MIKIENVVLPSSEQWKRIINGMRNPKNSWNRIDSEFYDYDCILGENDLKLATALANAGDEHGKFSRMIVVYADVTAPLYWWKEYDTYKVGTVTDSCSTMHKIHTKEFELDDFSCEHLTDSSKFMLCDIIDQLNYYKNKYNKNKDKKYWWQLIQLLPSSYNQKRTIMLNYQVLKHIYHQRKNHKLDEWHDFCDWIETLPYSYHLITKEK